MAMKWFVDSDKWGIFNVNNLAICHTGWTWSHKSYVESLWMKVLQASVTENNSHHAKICDKIFCQMTLVFSDDVLSIK